MLNGDGVLLLTEATLAGQATKSGGVLASASYLCQPCRQSWLNRPSVDVLHALLRAWNELHVCLPAGKILVWLVDQIMSWQGKANQELRAATHQLTRNKNAGNLV